MAVLGDLVDGAAGETGGTVAVGEGGVDLGQAGVVAGGHGDLVPGGALFDAAGLAVEHVHQGLVGVVVEVVDLVAAGEQVGDGLGGRLVGDGGADDVDHVAGVVAGLDAQLGVGVEAADGGEVDVAAEEGDAGGVGLGEVLEALDEEAALALVLAGGVVVVEVVEEIDLAVELVEEAAGEAEALVEEADGGDDGRAEDVLEPGEARVGDGDAEEDDQVLDVAVGGGDLPLEPVEDEVVGVVVVDLVAGALGAGVDADEGDALAQAHVQVATPLLDVGAGPLADDPAVVLGLVLEDVGVLELAGVGAGGAVDGLHGLGRVGGVGGERGRDVVLEEAVVLEGDAADAAEDGAAHEVVGVGAEAVDDVVVVPDVDLGDAAVGLLEGLGGVPADVVGVVVLVAALAHGVVKVVGATLVGVGDAGPLLQGPVDADAVVVDLVAAPDHDMEGLLGVDAQDIVPQVGAEPGVHVGTDGEAVAGVEHHAHGLVDGGDHKVPGGAAAVALGVVEAINGILPARLVGV